MKSYLDDVDLSVSVDRKIYEKCLREVQLRLVRLQRPMREAGLPLVIIYEGWDASGKGGSIKRITEPLDPRGYSVWPIAAPTDLENMYNYLWRFWTKLPPQGHIGIFDRSWYGRVLVERVEGFATEEEWKRAYHEIRNFEKILVDNGTALIKFWMHINKEEQLERFEKRKNDPFKKWKITEEDWRNREKWDQYAEAAEDMFRETDTDYAPWHIIPANSKKHARVQTATIVADTIEKWINIRE